MSEQPIELRLAVAEARIEALTAVVIAIAESVNHPSDKFAKDNMWGKIDGLEHAGAEILQDGQWVKQSDKH